MPKFNVVSTLLPTVFPLGSFPDFECLFYLVSGLRGGGACPTSADPDATYRVVHKAGGDPLVGMYRKLVISAYILF